MSTVLTSTVRMMNQAFLGAFVAHSTPQSLRRESLRHALTHGVSNQLAGEDVLIAGDVEPSLVSGTIGDVCHPGFVWPRWRERLVEQIVGDRQVVIRIRRGFEFALLLTPQIELSAQASDAVAAGYKALCLMLRLHASRALGLAALLVLRFVNSATGYANSANTA